MSEFELRRPYKLSEIIEIVTKDYWVINSGVKPFHCVCPDTGLYDLDIYTNKYEEFAYEDLICYLEEPAEVTDEDEEIFPDFVVQEGLAFLCSGEMLEMVIEAAFDQKRQPSMKEFVHSLNFYRIHDDFLDFSDFYEGICRFIKLLQLLRDRG